jgi:hypothetical protein
MSVIKAITGQLRAIANHVLRTKDYSAADLREIAVEMADTRAVIEAEILRLDGVSRQGRIALRELLTPNDAGARLTRTLEIPRR